MDIIEWIETSSITELEWALAEIKEEIEKAEAERTREVCGIVYGLKHDYPGTKEGKSHALREAYFQRNHNRFSRVMKIKRTGRWGVYVSYARRDE